MAKTNEKILTPKLWINIRFDAGEWTHKFDMPLELTEANMKSIVAKIREDGGLYVVSPSETFAFIPFSRIHSIAFEAE